MTTKDQLEKEFAELLKETTEKLNNFNKKSREARKEGVVLDFKYEHPIFELARNFVYEIENTGNVSGLWVASDLVCSLNY